jgi:uncharacterized protein YciI
MERVILAYDGTDEHALERRMTHREAHLALIKEMRPYLVHGGALLSDEGTMIGSLIITSFPTQKAFEDWMAREPFITHQVWSDVKILPFATAPSFVGNIPQPIS